MSHRHNIYASFDFEIASATTKRAAAVAEGGLDVVDVHRLLAHFQARGSVGFGTTCSPGPPSAVGRQGRVGRRHCRLAMYLRNETLTPMIRNQVSVRGNQCRQTEGMDGMKRIGLMLNVAGSMSLRGNDFPHRCTPRSCSTSLLLKDCAEVTQCLPGRRPIRPPAGCKSPAGRALRRVSRRRAGSYRTALEGHSVCAEGA
jgi:hypothetical protein